MNLCLAVIVCLVLAATVSDVLSLPVFDNALSEATASTSHHRHHHAHRAGLRQVQTRFCSKL